MKTIDRSSSTRRPPPNRAVAGTGANGNGDARSLTGRLGSVFSSDDGPIVDATLEGIADATKSVTDLIVRVRQVNNSLLGSEGEIGGAVADAPLPDGRAYLANVRVGELRNALVALAVEVARLERL